MAFSVALKLPLPPADPPANDELNESSSSEVFPTDESLNVLDVVGVSFTISNGFTAGMNTFVGKAVARLPAPAAGGLFQLLPESRPITPEFPRSLAKSPLLEFSLAATEVFDLSFPKIPPSREKSPELLNNPTDARAAAGGGDTCFAAEFA